MERRDWKAYRNCLKSCPFPHLKSRPFKWGHVYKMVARVDISPPGKWFSIYKITDATVWSLKMTVVTILLSKERGKPRFNEKPPSLKKTTLDVLESINLPTRSQDKESLWSTVAMPTSSYIKLQLSLHFRVFLKQPSGIQMMVQQMLLQYSE